MQYLYSLLTVTQRFDNTKRVERFDGQTDRGEHFEICQVAHENMVLRLSYPEGGEDTSGRLLVPRNLLALTQVINKMCQLKNQRTTISK